MRPEVQYLENIIFEVFTLCGSNRFKIFLIVLEKFNFQDINYHGNAPDLSIFEPELRQIWCISIFLKLNFSGTIKNFLKRFKPHRVKTLNT